MQTITLTTHDHQRLSGHYGASRIVEHDGVRYALDAGLGDRVEFRTDGHDVLVLTTRANMGYAGIGRLDPEGETHDDVVRETRIAWDDNVDDVDEWIESTLSMWVDA